MYFEEFKEMSEEIEDSYKKLHEKITKFKDEDIYLWYGNSAMETCGMLHVLSMLEEKIENVCTINVSDITYNTGKRNDYTPRVVGELTPERLGEFIGINQSMDFSRYSSLMSLWKQLKREKSNLRIYEDKEVKSVQEDYYDEMILRYTYKKFMYSARTVGEVIGKVESYVSDSIIFGK
nr:DUF3658 domain-containing protein [Clostridium estertheticum]